MNKDFINIIQMSDMHLFADKTRNLLGVNTHESFQAIVDLIKTEKNYIDLILLSGDLTQDGSPESYKHIADSLQVFDVPIYFVPGNHDNTFVMESVYPLGKISNDKQIILNNWQLILLNSQKPGAVEGWFDQSQLNYLKKCLQGYPNHHSIVVSHHPPVSVGAQWLDNLGVENSLEFWKIISAHQNVNAVFFGHVHQEYEKVVDGIKCYSAPSTCIQFMRKQEDFGLENLPPGFRWIHLFKDGHMETGIKRLKKYVGKFDKNAKGY